MTYDKDNIIFSPHPHIHNFQDLTGQIFTRLTVMGYAGISKDRKSNWFCQCQCGNIAIVRTTHLKCHVVRSCGCLLKEFIKQLNRTHGQSHSSPEYILWCGMRARCLNRHHHSYKNYGGRGIQICERWNDFAVFIQDMGNRPSPKHSIERIDNDGHYAPDNCYWASPTEQANNRRNNRLLTLNGKTQTMKQWSDELHINYTTLNHRIYLGWTDTRALMTPVRTRPSQLKTTL